MAREELATLGPWKPEHVLQVRRGRRQCSGDRRIERAAHECEEQHRCDPGADLEATIPDVLVRHAVAREVQQDTEQNRTAPRADDRAADGAGRNVKGDDHVLIVISLPQRRVDSCAALVGGPENTKPRRGGASLMSLAAFG
jgi:hypothetical protein